MNKLVYLFELDSVRSTDVEVKAAQQALYDETVVSANTVVISFNQLTDSRALVSMLETEERLGWLFSLFDLGAIRFSRYGRTRTASQYVQGGFHLAGRLPVESRHRSCSVA